MNTWFSLLRYFGYVIFRFLSPARVPPLPGLWKWSQFHDFQSFPLWSLVQYTFWTLQGFIWLQLYKLGIPKLGVNHCARFGCFHERASGVFGRLCLCGVFMSALCIVLLTNNHCHTSLDSNRQPLGGVARVQHSADYNMNLDLNRQPLRTMGI